LAILSISLLWIISHSIGFLRGYDNCKQNVNVPKSQGAQWWCRGTFYCGQVVLALLVEDAQKTGMDPFNFYLIVI